jgi:hypothetical protein
VTVEIEGDHIAAVVWRDRLHLFWVTFLQKSGSNAGNPPPGGTSAASSMTLPDLMGAAAATEQKLAQLQLHWSEYFQGQWRDRASSDSAPKEPIRVGSFDWSRVFIHVSKEYAGDVEGAVKLHLTSPSDLGIRHAFRLTSKNSQPKLVDAESPAPPPYDVDASQAEVTRYDAGGELTVKFIEKIETEDGKRPVQTWVMPQILGQGTAYSLLLPDNPLSLLTSNNDDIGPLVAPFFYEDALHTFFVEPSLTETTSERWEDWILGVPSKPRPPLIDIPIHVFIPDPLVKRPDPGDPAYDHSIFELGSPSDWATGPGTAITFGDRLIGKEGALEVTASGPAALTAIGGAGLTAGLLQGVNSQVSTSASVGLRAGAAAGSITG